MTDIGLTAFHLPVFKFHRCGTTKNSDGDAQFAALGIDFFDNSSLVLERAVGNFY